MIQIIGDTTDELADVQTLLEPGKLKNCHKDIKVRVAFKLSSGGTLQTLLIAQYSHKQKINELKGESEV